MATKFALPVVYEEQRLFYLCGPACINMVLSRWGKNINQDAVWSAVQANTFATRPPDAPVDDGSFPNQFCEFCGTATLPDGTIRNIYECWYTSPAAMAATIAESSPSGVTVEYISGFDDTIRRIADSIATYATPAVFTTSALHFEVAYGYEYASAQPAYPLSSVQWNAQFITGIYVLNPARGSGPGTNDLTMVTPRGFGALVACIECGVNAGKNPVVGGAHVNWLLVHATVFIRLLKAWIDPRKYKVFTKRPAKPPLPPPPTG